MTTNAAKNKHGWYIKTWTKLAAILQKIFWNTFAWMEVLAFLFFIDNKVMTWHWKGDKTPPEPMLDNGTLYEDQESNIKNIKSSHFAAKVTIHVYLNLVA